MPYSVFKINRKSYDLWNGVISSDMERTPEVLRSRYFSLANIIETGSFCIVQLQIIYFVVTSSVMCHWCADHSNSWASCIMCFCVSCVTFSRLLEKVFVFCQLAYSVFLLVYTHIASDTLYSETILDSILIFAHALWSRITNCVVYGVHT